MRKEGRVGMGSRGGERGLEWGLKGKDGDRKGVNN